VPKSPTGFDGGIGEEMGFTFVASESGYEVPNTTTIDTGGTLNIAAKDVLIAVASWEGSDTSLASVQTTDTDNAMTLLTVNNGNNVHQQIAYILVGAANANATFRATFNAACTYRHFVVFQFRPAGTDTISFDKGPGSAHASSTALSSADITPAGTLLAVVGGGHSFTNSTFANDTIGEVASDGQVTPSAYGSAWYKIYSASPGGAIDADADVGASDWVADIIAIKGVAAVGGRTTKNTRAFPLGEAIGMGFRF